MMKIKDEQKTRDARIDRTVMRCWTSLVLIMTLIVAGYLRFSHLDWDDFKHIHPDESHMQQTLSKIHIPENVFQVYFDTATSPLNVQNSGANYSYGFLPMFLTRLVSESLDQACFSLQDRQGRLAEEGAELTGVAAHTYQTVCQGGSFTGYRSKLVGRALSGLADLGTILLVFLIGRRLYGRSVGLLAAALTALTVFLIQQAHFFTVESILCFFMTLTVYLAICASLTGSWWHFGLAGVAAGLSGACKVSGGLVSFTIALAAVIWIWRTVAAPTRGAGEAGAASTAEVEPPVVERPPLALSWPQRIVLRGLLRLALAAVACLIVFRIAEPYAFTGPGFFGVSRNSAWWEYLESLLHVQSSDWDAPPALQWAKRAPWLFPGRNMVVWGMGLPLGLTAWAGWALAGLEMWRGRRVLKRLQKHVILWAWVGLMFFYLGSRWVKSMRYFVFLYPLLVIFGAYLLVRLSRAGRNWLRGVGMGLTVVVVVGTALWAVAFFSIYQREHTRLAAGQWIFDHAPDGSVLAQEHWDWGPHIPGGKSYTIFEMELFHEDTWDKREQLYGWLDRADYVVISSNRIYASVARLKGTHASRAEDYRYPLTTAYYRALFAGKLGFELAADFTSRPAIGLFQFPDQETPYPLMEPAYAYQQEPIKVYLPPAEEAFSVYDHPRVLIFRKTDAYSRQLVEGVLGDIKVDHALRGVKPVDFTTAPDLMQYDDQTWAQQQAGGTWSRMFNRDGLFNRYPALSIVSWWVVVTLLGWLAFPLLHAALPRLRDRGYGLARIFVLLALAYLTWIGASLHMLPNTRGTILRFVLLLLLVGGGVGWLRRHKLRRFVMRNWRTMLVMEGVFALLYLAWIVVRLLQPDLWHPFVGGEKPMDMAFFNATMKSTWFPPYNPWFAGHYLNYYYFGFVIVGTLTKLMGTAPAIAYNLLIPLLYALTGLGAFSVAYNAFGGHRRGAYVAGVMALLFVVVLGNLGVVHLIRKELIELDTGTGGILFESSIPGYPETVSMLRGLYKIIVKGHSFPVGSSSSSWYWHPTRIIPQDTGHPIAEFPIFTFLYADLHAHMMAFPLTLLALGLIVYWARDWRPTWSSLLIGGLTVGALRPTNTWDYYPYLALGALSILLGAINGWLARRRRGDTDGLWRWGKALVLRIACFVALTTVLFLPYIRHYAGYSAVEVWQDGRTPATIYLWIHGALLFAVVTRLLIEVGRVFRWRQDGGRGFRARPASHTLALWGGTLLVTVVLILTLGRLSQALRNPQGNLADEIVPVSLVAMPVAVLTAVLLFAPGRSFSRRVLWLMIGLTMAISIGVEVIVVQGDVGRQNTVFKFYLQVWIMLSIAAGLAIAWLNERSRRWLPVVLSRLWWGGMVVLILASALFLPFGIYARATSRISSETGLTLDGMAFIKHSSVCESPPGANCETVSLTGDYHAIRWMQDTVSGSPVVMEGLGWREYLWASRISSYTGLPSVIGWRWHQVQQHPMLPASIVDRRRSDVTTCYNTADVALAVDILSRYNVRYVYVGPYERACKSDGGGPCYSWQGLAKFDHMVDQGLMRVAYNRHGVTIYEVLD